MAEAQADLFALPTEAELKECFQFFDCKSGGDGVDMDELREVTESARAHSYIFSKQV